jgi:hypothetical protein
MLEKRLGIAQLCLLLAVLVFIGLTRGSRSEAPMALPPSRKPARSWRPRQLSLSGDWVTRLRARTSSVSPDEGVVETKKNAVAFGSYTQVDFAL